MIGADQEICARAALHADRYALRGFDAVHLASAEAAGAELVTFDRSLAEAAQVQGLTVIGV